MQKGINPVLAGIVIAVLVVIVGALIWKHSRSDAVPTQAEAAQMKAAKLNK